MDVKMKRKRHKEEERQGLLTLEKGRKESAKEKSWAKGLRKQGT